MATKDQDAALLQEVLAGELRVARARVGLTQEELADAAGLHRTTANRLLVGTRKVDVQQLLDLAKALNTTAGEILDGAQREYERRLAARQEEAATSKPKRTRLRDSPVIPGSPPLGTDRRR